MVGKSGNDWPPIFHCFLVGMGDPPPPPSHLTLFHLIWQWCLRLDFEKQYVWVPRSSKHLIDTKSFVQLAGHCWLKHDKLDISKCPPLGSDKDKLPPNSPQQLLPHKAFSNMLLVRVRQWWVHIIGPKSEETTLSLAMDILREFLESSTIHGLTYISTTRVGFREAFSFLHHVSF